ncbi:uncharacterized [Tachysurus ichikawai]
MCALSWAMSDECEQGSLDSCTLTLHRSPQGHVVHQRCLAYMLSQAHWSTPSRRPFLNTLHLFTLQPEL